MKLKYNAEGQEVIQLTITPAKNVRKRFNKENIHTELSENELLCSYEDDVINSNIHSMLRSSVHIFYNVGKHPQLKPVCLTEGYCV